MQWTVDRHDQLRSMFSLAGRHKFKKYYIKLILGLIDMAVVNAFILYKMSLPKEEQKKRNLKHSFYDRLSTSLMKIHWPTTNVTSLNTANVKFFEDLTGVPQRRVEVHDEVVGDLTPNSFKLPDSEVAKNQCVFIAMSKFPRKSDRGRGHCCQICNFEGRGDYIVSDVVMCMYHGVRVCAVPRPHKFDVPQQERKWQVPKSGRGGQWRDVPVQDQIVTDYSWRCQDETLTCWQKLHDYYLQRGLFHDKKWDFGEPGTPKYPVMQKFLSGCDIWKHRRHALGLDPTVLRLI